MREYVEVEHTSWGNRIGNSIGGIFFGILLVIIGIGLIWYNEGRSVKRSKDLKEGKGQTVSLETIDSVDDALDGKLVHATGKAVTSETLKDPIFGIEAKAITLNRVVEMYQYEEKKRTEETKKVGGGTTKETTYSYHETWDSKRIDSSKFKSPEAPQNPQMKVKGQTMKAKQVTFGAFTLPPNLVSKIEGGKTISPNEQALQAAMKIRDNAKLDGDHIYLGDDPRSATVGDLRISFQMTPENTVSLLGEQKGSTFREFKTSNGGTIFALRMGELTSDEMYNKEKQDNFFLTWGLRVGGFLLILFGFNLILGPLSVLADVIPLIGNIVGGVTFVVSLVIATGLSSLVAAIAWVFYRPIVGLPLLTVTLCSFVCLFFVGKKR
jgi:hypothetical protein